MTRDEESETSSDSIYDIDSPQSSSDTHQTAIAIAQEEHVMESDIEESSNSKKKKRHGPLDHTHLGNESQRPRTSELINLLRELTNCKKTDKIDIMDAAADYIRAMEGQIQMMKSTANMMQNCAVGMYYGMQLPAGTMVPPPQVLGCAPPLEAAAAAAFQEYYHQLGMMLQPQMLAMYNSPTSTSTGPAESCSSVSSDSTTTTQDKPKTPS